MPAESILYAASRCIRITLLCGSRLRSYSSYGPITDAISAERR